MMVDDEPLLDEIITTVGELCFRCTEYALSQGARFDYAHFWEDICFKNGPLISPEMFSRKIGPQYRRITDLLHDHGIHIVSVDCDGWIDALIPTWLENGVNTMFPIEVGTWKASIKLKPGRYEYRFWVNGEWQDGPNAQERISNPFGSYNSIKIVN